VDGGEPVSTPETARFGPPAGYSDADELPATEWPEIELWSENYFFCSWDPSAELGIWLHLGRMPNDPTLWREMIFFYLPDGTILNGKSYGRHQSESGPGSGTLTFECVEPWNRWRQNFDGVLVRSDFEKLDRGLLELGIYVPAALQLEWRPLAPIFEMGTEMQKQAWGHTHYNQLGRLVGSVRCEDKEVDFDGVGVRDHTRGPRDFRKFVWHCWHHGVFEDGRGFMVVDAMADGDNRLERAMVLSDGEITEVGIIESGALSSREDGYRDYEIRFEGQEPIKAHVLHNNPMGFAADNEITYGHDPEVSTHHLFEGFTRFKWDGVVGHGLTERSLRHS
jgi:hypothetical protein